MKRFFVCLLVLIGFLYSCKDNTIRNFNLKDAELIDVSNEIQDVVMDQMISSPFLEISDKYLIIVDVLAADKGIHIFEREKLQFLESTGILGEGPGQISRYGPIAFSPSGQDFWMPDFGKLKIFKYNIDSILVDDQYLPSISKSMEMDFFLTRFKFIQDEIVVGAGLEPLSNSTFRISLGKWDLNTGTVEKFGEEHPDLMGERTNAYFDYSPEHQMMVLTHIDHDILTVYNTEGEVKYHVLGQRKFDNERRKLKFFGPVHITEKYIFTSYLGKEGFEIDENNQPKSVPKTKILAFDLEGRLAKVFETGHELGKFVVDEKNRRVICYFEDREEPIGFFNFE